MNASPWTVDTTAKIMRTAAGGELRRCSGSHWALWKCARCGELSPAPGPEVERLADFSEWRDRHAGAACS